MGEPSYVVVKVEECGMHDAAFWGAPCSSPDRPAVLHAACPDCLGDGRRAVLETAVEVEPLGKLGKAWVEVRPENDEKEDDRGA